MSHSSANLNVKCELYQLNHFLTSLFLYLNIPVQIVLYAVTADNSFIRVVRQTTSASILDVVMNQTTAYLSKLRIVLSKCDKIILAFIKI